MRPVHLEIQGFTCYREKQPIDFTPLTLFAIAGPTGAGKSSILDAIAFALYGKVPRLGGQNLSEFISLGASRASVLFEFDMQGARYRIARSILRRGANKAQLEQISNGTQRALADGVDAVNDKLKALLGLDYSAFVQSVLLPQGEFARFLKSTPGEQRKILRELLRLGVYECMREGATAQTRELAAQIDTDRKMLNGPYAGATREHVANIEAQLRDLVSQKDLAVEAHLELSRSLDIMRKQWELVLERQKRRTTLQRLREREPDVEKLKNAVARARQAAVVVPLFNLAEAKLHACSKLATEVQALEQNLEVAKRSAQQAKDKLTAAEQQANELPAKRQRVTELASIQPVLRERRELASRYVVARSDVAKTVEAIHKEKATVEEEREAAAKCAAKAEEIGKQRSDLGYDAVIHETFKTANRLAYDLGQERRRLTDLNPAEADTRLQIAEAALHKTKLELNAMQADEVAAQSELKTAQDTYEAAQDQNRAAALRAHLTPGCSCPVCEQTVQVIPATSISADLQERLAAVNSAKKKCERVAKSATAVRDRFSRAQADEENARKNEAQSRQQAAACTAKVERFTAQLSAKIRPFECPPGDLIDQFVEREFERIDKLHGAWQQLGEKLNQAEIERHRAAAARDAAEQRLQTEQNNSARLSADIADAETRLAGYDSQIAAVSSADPDKELKLLKNEMEVIEKQHQLALELHERADAQVRDAELKCTEARTRLASSARERDESQATAGNALRQAGFADAIDARKASLDPAAIARLERDIETFEGELNRTTARIQELDTQLEGIALTQDDVNRATEKCAAAQTLVRDLERQIGEHTSALLHLKEATAKADALRLEHASRVSRHTVMQQLSADLRGDCFQEYLLRGSFKRLVDGASTRLRLLNDRYGLTIMEGKFAVIDHDHGSQHRLADTLSGGETFLVSLALALELSEQIQQAAGAVRLDSLFIDEGFGTLDPEALDTVADAIESLSRTNRLVGIITHVTELHRRLPRLEVRPGPSGSVVEYVED